MLSAIVKCLPLIRKESNADRRQVLVDICVSAYPDLCPWQLKEALLDHQENTAGETLASDTKNDLRDLYYYYLSSLLHPHDGHEAARQDAGLVEVRGGCDLCRRLRLFRFPLAELFFFAFIGMVRLIIGCQRSGDKSRY